MFLFICTSYCFALRSKPDPFKLPTSPPTYQVDAAINAGNSGGAYLNLNGCNETVAALLMATNTMVKTDSPAGKTGVLTVKALTVNNVKKPAGTYTAATEKWLEGKGKVVVVP